MADAPNRPTMDETTIEKIAYRSEVSNEENISVSTRTLRHAEVSNLWPR